jgi:hypothetical protein
MKKILLVYSLLLFAVTARPQQRKTPVRRLHTPAAMDIRVSIKPYKNQYIYLGYYYGKIKALADSAFLDGNGYGAFRSKQKLPGGIYFIVSPYKAILFELLLDKQQQFAIVADSAGLPEAVKFTGTPENNIFQQYSRFTSEKGKAINDMYAQLRTATTIADSNRISAQIANYNQLLTRHRDSIIAKNPQSLLSAIFRSMKEPVVPPGNSHPGSKYDSLFAYLYFKEHYWEGVSFTDERLLRTPIFEQRMDKYYKELVVPAPDSIIKEADNMLQQTGANKEMFKYILTYLVQKYIKPEYMGQDAVFVHLFEKYINNNTRVDWFTDAYKKYMFERAYSLMANLIGNPAQELEMVDTSGKPSNLYSVQAPFTVICFWDPTCSHCKELVPRLDSIYQNKWRKQGVALYGVMTDGGKEAWLKYIRENNLSGWIHVYQTQEQKDKENAAGKASYKQLYDVYQTPVLYLLDKEKRIIAKKLTFEQVDEVMKQKMKSNLN